MMITRWLCWAAVACFLIALWALVGRTDAEGRDVTLAQASAQSPDPDSFKALLPKSDRADEATVVVLKQTASPEELRRERRLRGLVSGITIFVIAIFLGVELINRVPATLHTPLMSGSNAISGITVVGAIIAAGVTGRVAPFLGFAAVVLAMINVVGGFLVTHRMLLMFKRR